MANVKSNIFLSNAEAEHPPPINMVNMDHMDHKIHQELAKRFTIKGATDGEIVEAIMEVSGWNKERAEAFLERLMREGRILQDPEGYLRWVQ